MDLERAWNWLLARTMMWCARHMTGKYAPKIEYPDRPGYIYGIAATGTGEQG